MANAIAKTQEALFCLMAVEVVQKTGRKKVLVRKHIKSFSVVESHFCRKSTEKAIVGLASEPLIDARAVC